VRTCPECKHKYSPKFNSLQPTCNNLECLVTFVKKQRVAKVKADKQKSKEFKQKHRIEDVGYQKELTQPVFNRMRVLEELAWFAERNIEPYCISCGKTHRKWSCGHLKTVGAQSGLRFDRQNTFLQCWWRCNKNLSGNIEGNKTTHGYKKGLILRFGEEEGQSIINYCDTHTSPGEWNWLDLKIFRAECNAKIRKLTKFLKSPGCY